MQFRSNSVAQQSRRDCKTGYQACGTSVATTEDVHNLESTKQAANNHPKKKKNHQKTLDERPSAKGNEPASGRVVPKENGRAVMQRQTCQLVDRKHSGNMITMNKSQACNGMVYSLAGSLAG